MNYNQRLVQISKLNQMIINRRGGCMFHKQNTDDHEDWKWHCYKMLRKKTDRVYTESTVKGLYNKFIRPDVVAISNEGIGIIIEILATETEEKCMEKTSFYPKEFELIKVKVGEEPEIPF